MLRSAPASAYSAPSEFAPTLVYGEFTGGLFTFVFIFGWIQGYALASLILGEKPLLFILFVYRRHLARGQQEASLLTF